MYLKKKKNKRYLCFDIEADSLTPTKVWCIVVKDIFSGETYVFNTRRKVYEDFPKFVAKNSDAIWVGHNIICFDIPCCNDLLGTSIAVDDCIDTLVLSYLYHPHMPKGHSLGAWGERLNYPKGEFEDWSRYSQRMLEYCQRDVDLNVEVYLKLSQRMYKRGFSEMSCWIEHHARRIINEQELNGFKFDVPAARKLLASLRAKENELVAQIQSLFPPLLKPVCTYKYRVKADGQPYASYFRHQERFPDLVFNEAGDEYTVYDYQDFNLGSPKQRAERLLSLGWTPTSFTPTGQPKVDESSLLEFAESSGIPEVAALADWLVANGRGNMVETWLKCVGDDERIHGTVFSCGAGTRRMRHTTPNTANIPGNEAKYGKECRSLWTTSSGRTLLGVDAKGLEGRVMVHYANDDRAYDYFITNDPHDANAEALGIARKSGKNVFYASIYGASHKKLKAMHGGTKSGKWVKETLFGNIPGFDKLFKQIQQEFKRHKGWIKTIDGGFVRCPSEHAALNYKFQSAGGIIMKLAAIILDEKASHLDYMKVGDIHDEWQFDVHPDHAEELGKLACEAMIEAGERLEMRVPIEGDYQIGKTWAETH